MAAQEKPGASPQGRRWDRKRYQLNRAHLLAQALQHFPPGDKPICVREIISLSKAALSVSGDEPARVVNFGGHTNA